MASYYQTAVSWAFVLAAAAALTYYYRPQAFHKLLPEKNPPIDTRFEEKKAGKKLKQRALKTIRQGDTMQKQRAANAGQDGEVRGVSSAIQVTGNVTAQREHGRAVTLRRDEEGAISDKDFAQELKKAQAGTKLEPRADPSAKQGKRKRDHKDLVEVNGASQKFDQRQNFELDSTHDSSTTKQVTNSLSETSSTTGRDGDDDMSGTGSPLSSAATSRADDISDMLKPASAKPMTLSITNVNTVAPKSKPQPRQFERAESKKQRQRRLKRDQQKLEVEHSNAEHEKKKQNQLRIARMADGSSAQLRTNSFKPTSQNVWQGTPQALPVAHSIGSSGQLLDTIEPVVESDAPRSAVTSKPADSIVNVSETSTVKDMESKFGGPVTSPLGASGREVQPTSLMSLDWADDVTEDELRQRGILKEAEDEWQDVTTKKGKRRGPKIDDTSSDASSGMNRSHGVGQQNGVNRFHSFQNHAE